MSHAGSNTHTFFFREPDAIELVRRIAKMRQRQIAVWSAGCSTGDEVYSLAIRLDGLSREITGSDVRGDVLAIAESGVYPVRHIRHTDADTKRLYFSQVGDTVRVDGRLRRDMRFVRHHIVDETPLTPLYRPAWDVIFCRNVLLYYEDEQTVATLARLANVLAPDGTLVLGASEWVSSALLAKIPKEQQVVAELEGQVVVYRRGALPVTHEHVPTKRTRPAVAKWAPTDVDSLRRQGDALMDSGDTKGAVVAFQQGLRLNPLAADLHARLAFCHLAVGRTAEAETDLRRSLFLAPTLWPAALVLGDLLMVEDAQAARRYLLQAWHAVESGSLDTASADTAHVAPFICTESSALDAVRVRLAWLKARETG